MKKINIIAGILILSSLESMTIDPATQKTGNKILNVKSAIEQVKDNSVWPRPRILPLPAATTEVENPVLSLSGTWQINLNAPDNYWENGGDPGTWQDIKVPASASSQGIRATGLSAMRKKILIPADYAGKRVFLRLDGVSGESRLYVNGKFIRDHSGSYTAWSADITDAVIPGKEAWIIVGFERSG